VSQENHGQTAFGFKGKGQDNNEPTVTPNASWGLVSYLKSLKREVRAEEVKRVWHHILAISYAPVYLEENAAGRAVVCIRNAFRVCIPPPNSLRNEPALTSTLGIHTKLIDQLLYPLFEARIVGSGEGAAGESTGVCA